MTSTGGHHGKAVLLRSDTYVEKEWTIVCHAFSQAVLKLIRPVYAACAPAKCARKGHEIWQRRVPAVAQAVAVVQFLPLAHHAHVAVVGQHEFDRCAVLYSGGQFLDVHENGCVATDADHCFVRVGDLGALIRHVRLQQCDQSLTGAGQCQGKKAALKPLAQLPVWAFSG